MHSKDNFVFNDEIARREYMLESMLKLAADIPIQAGFFDQAFLS